MWNDDRWRDAYRLLVGFTALPHENAYDIVEGCYALGMHRAELLEKDFEEGVDISHAMSYFFWWLFKPKPADNVRIYMQEHRWKLFTGAYESEEIRQNIVRAVPEDVLTLNIDGLFDLLRSGEVRKLEF